MDRRSFLDRSIRGLVGSAALGSSFPRQARGARPDAPTVGHSPVHPRQEPPYALVLGSIQDAGLPQVGCYTPRCDAGRALDPPRFVASLALVDPDSERFYLVDATPDITRQIDLLDSEAFRRRAGERRPFDGIFLTHAHIGHYTGLAVLGNEGLGMQETPVYCTAPMAAFLRSNQPWGFMIEQGRIALNPLSVDAWHRIDDRLSVRLHRVPHRDEFADTVGFEFRGPSRALFYLPDINSWNAWDRDVADVVTAVDVALLDGSFYSPSELPRLALEDIPHPLIPDSMDGSSPSWTRASPRSSSPT